MSTARLRSRSSAAISLLVPLALIALTVLIGVGSTPSFQGTLALILCNLIIVLGLQVFIGNSGVYSFGQIAFAAAGAYLGALLTLPSAIASLQTPDLPALIADADPGPLFATLIAALACGLLAAIVGLPLMRTSTLAIPISTFAFLIVAYNVLANWDPVTGGASGLVAIPPTTSVESAGLWACLAVIGALAFKWSASGYRLQASREDEVVASALGIYVMRERLIAFALSGALCGIGGALAVHQSGVLDPSTFYFTATVTTLTMLVFGGARSVLGAVLGTLSVASVTEVLRGVEEGGAVLSLVSIGAAPGLATIGLGLILLATMIAMPNGITGGREAGELLARLRRLGPEPSSMRAPRASLKQSVGIPEDAALRAERIVVNFGGLRVLRGVDLELRPGETLGLIGPNGAGKTTLVNVLSAFQRPDAGSVSLDGVDVTTSRPPRLARVGLARTFQSGLPFAHLSVLENITLGAFGVGEGGKSAAALAGDVLRRLGLGEQAEHPAGSLTPAGQRLLGVARALATTPRYLLLDEPAAGLGDHERDELVEILCGVGEDFGCGILLIEHDFNLVSELCQRVQVLDGGVSLRTGRPEEIRADPAVVEAYLGTSVPGALLA